MKSNIKKKITTITSTILVGVTALLFVGATGVNAIGEGQIAGGNIYRIKNITQGKDFAQVQTADKCDILQYKVRLHNPGPGVVNNVNVRVNLPGGVSSTNVSTVTITGQNAQPSTVTATATLQLSTPQSVSYISGSTQLLDSNSNVLKTLPDTIMSSGVNIGDVGVSLNETKHVQFKAKVNCPQKPPCKDNPKTPEDECHPKPPCKDNPKTPEDECNPKPPCVDNPDTSKDECNPSSPPPTDTTPPPTSVTTSSSPQMPGSLPDTGPADVVAAFGIVTFAAATAYYVTVRRLWQV